nr:MAG TPA: hypothetical protein [Caudoviricetes sp.]
MNPIEIEDAFIRTLRQKGVNEYTPIRIHIGSQLYDVDHIDTVIDMDTNKPIIVIHVKEN